MVKAVKKSQKRSRPKNRELQAVEIPSIAEFNKGVQAFQKRDKRNAMYKTAIFLVSHFWGKPSEMADSLGVLLLTWNQAFYRYGLFDFDKLEACLSRNMEILDSYRDKSILDYSPADDKSISKLFREFLVALQICERKKKGTRSSVATSKALHLLAPSFFPLWDDRIARGYHCHYSYDPAGKYLVFMERIKKLAEKIQISKEWQATGETLLKMIDEYNYTKYTKYTQRWIP